MPSPSAVRVRDAKPREKPYKLFDERGLYLLVTPSADQHRGRLWRFRYRHNGTEKLLALGTYPDVSLKRAREKRDEARRLIADGIDPNVQRKAERAASTETFEAIGREWLAHRAKTTAAITQQRRHGCSNRYSLKSVVDPSGTSRPRNSWPRCGRSKLAGITRVHTGRSNNAGRCFGTRSQPAAPSGIFQQTSGARWCP
jgi:Arm DNA-binding domain